MSKKRGPHNDPTARFALTRSGTDQLAAVLDTLSELEANVITMRFGIIDGQPKTLDELALLYGLTARHIHIIETKVLLKLRHPARSNVLAEWDGDQRTGFIDALFGRRSSSGDELTLCAYCRERWFNAQTGASTGGRKREYCSGKCRQAAYRARHHNKA